MRTATTEAFARLVSSFVTAIEDTGADLPADIAQRLAENPLKACELLNELAISTGALDEQTDAAIAYIYESMDGADARSPMDDASRARILVALAEAHREKPAPEPEPEPEPEPTAVHQPDSSEEAKPKPKRRGKRAGSEPVFSEAEVSTQQEASPQQQGTNAEAEAGEDSTPEKPARKRQRKPRKTSDEQAAAAAPAQTTAESAPEPPAAPEPEQASLDFGSTPQLTTAEPAGDAPADVPEEPVHAATTVANAQSEAENETLSVDQTVAILGMSRPTVYKLIESGKLPAHKKGRSWRISSAAVAQLAATKA